MTPRRAMSIGGLVVLVGTVAIIGSHPQPNAPETPASPASAGDPRWVQGIGYTEPLSEVRRLSFEVDGVIAECLVRPGQEVAAGDDLVCLQSDEEQAAVAAAQAERDRAQAELDQLLAGTHPDEIAAAEQLLELRREQLDHAVKQRARIAALSNRNVTTQLEVDDAETAVRQSELQIARQQSVLRSLREAVRDVDRRVAEAAVDVAESQLKLARERLRLTTLLAPFDGVVLDVLKREGETLRMGDVQPVILFGDLSQLRVRAEIDERYVRLLERGQPAEVFGTNLRDRRYEAHVELVKPVMGPKTVFSRSNAERKDLHVVEVLLNMDADFAASVGLRVDVAVNVSAREGVPERPPANND